MAHRRFREVVQDKFWLRALIFLICIPSGAAVLTEVYGLVGFHDVVWFAAVPSYLILFALWLFNRRGSLKEISDAIAIGVVGGFLGAVAYDVARIPFLFAGYRIFAQMGSYGLWILDVDHSTRFSELTGWIYHFANGALFGVMYAIFMRDRPWWWAVAWAFLLETIALVSPYGRIYHITASPLLVVVAYYGHVAYAVPLGLMVRRWERSAATLGELSPVYRIAIAVMLGAALVGPAVAPQATADDALARDGVFVVRGERLIPNWQRLAGPGALIIRNDAAPKTILVAGRPVLQLAPNQTASLSLPAPGIHLVAVAGQGLRTRSSFVLVDPVSAAP